MEVDTKLSRAIVTGGASGLGKEIVFKLLNLGFQVIVLDLNPISFDFNENYGNKLTYFKVDLSNTEEIMTFILNNKSLFTQINTIVLNAAPRVFKPFSDFNNEELIGLTNASFTSSIILLNSVIKNMISNNYGRIIVISSKSGLKGYSTGSIYCSLKSAWITFHESLSRELTNINVTINTICPDSFSRTDGSQLRGSKIIKNNILNIVANAIISGKSKIFFPVLIKTRIGLVVNIFQKILKIIK